MFFILAEYFLENYSTFYVSLFLVKYTLFFFGFLSFFFETERKGKTHLQF